MAKESKIKIKPRFITRFGIPRIRTPTDIFGEEISINQKGLTNNENRTDLVMKKHKTKHKQKQSDNTKTKTKKQEKK